MRYKPARCLLAARAARCGVFKRTVKSGAETAHPFFYGRYNGYG
ncbi:hypothetical protein HMPREF0860_1703 [Treponema socranskii subsp. socranskii VPI DR56BR1116 = ATCC 35536]|uniref:Uncharacterized protein n=1 Tax=Treponema socranskii subsp. socranskii VPI DR56BR1116 = ATCC 35536 TaxID=1125725 RepID=U1GSZ1_TRESO|nr:hypothetical protein HMPREF1325_0937 [Treponema socranskii subsp. socranskii VPI DR56BR1116 = ATCC 35536]ERK04420.1 hypothetical protein HMPREF0860_1703 [Treponema socranskii subsp. socranskii VPI DR56BR1116 = ATCC 35536]